MSATTAPFVGGGLKRKEDPTLITGQGRFTDDITVPGSLHMAMVRSPMAHARITSVDTGATLARDDVVAVVTGADVQSMLQSPLPMAWPVTEDIKLPPHWPLAVDKVRYVGDAVAAVVATSRYAAEDAAETVVVEYEPLPAVVDMDQATAGGGPSVHDEAPDNVCFRFPFGDKDAVDAALAAADVTVKQRMVNQRLAPVAIETRAVLASPTPAAGELTIWSSTQIPHLLKIQLSLILGVSEAKIRVIAPDVGGGFGSKLNVYAEEVLCAALARKLGRPVKWVETRSEGLQATIHGRDQIEEIELAASKEGRVTAIRCTVQADMGAYLQLLTPGIPVLTAFMVPAVYDVPAFYFDLVGVFTNKTPTDAYRGAGRPEATYMIERGMDVLAAELGMDPAELRRRNFIAADKFPFTTATTLVYDSADYEPALQRALDMIGYDDLRAEQQRRRDAGDSRLLGVGLSTYTEICGLAPSQVLGALRFGGGGWESAQVRLLPTGKAMVITGTSPHGQGHVTTWSQIVADKFGVTPDDVEVIHGDTAYAPLGMGTYGSRSLAVGGTALAMSCDKIVDKARLIAAHQLECDPTDLDYEIGRFTVRGSPDRGMGIGEVAFASFTAHNLPEGVEPNLDATTVWDPPNFTFPFGAHAAVVEVDAETGKVVLHKYVAVDDCGNVINPMIVDGQVHGGIAQGAAQALFEEVLYDDSGNLLTGTLVDYAVPTAMELPSYDTDRTVTPSPTNPLGVKGVGEAGTIASTPAVVNAVVDALAPLGVRHIDMPCTPIRVWQTIQEARS